MRFSGWLTTLAQLSSVPRADYASAHADHFRFSFAPEEGRFRRGAYIALVGYLTPLQRRGLALSGVALSFCTLIVSQLGRFVKRKFFFLRTFFTRCTSSPILVSLVGTSLLTLQIIPHPPLDCNRQNAQNRDFYFLDICATFRLTNCWRCVIMEIPRPSTVGAATNLCAK